MLRARRAVRSVPLALLALLAACGDDGDEANAKGARPVSGMAASDVAAPVFLPGPDVDAIPDGFTLRVANQSDTVELAWEAAGADDDAPYDIEWSTFSGAPPIFEALRAGATDIGSVGESPVPIAVANGAEDLVIVAASASAGGGMFLVAQRDAAVTDVAELRGRKVALPPGTTRHTFVIRALDEAGLTPDDVEIVEVPGAEVAPVFASGAVDAAVLLESQYYALSREPVVLRDSVGLNFGLNFFVTTRQVLEDPEKSAAIGDFLSRFVGARNWLNAERETWIETYYVGTENLTREEAVESWERAGDTVYRPLDEDVVTALETIARDLAAIGVIDGALELASVFDDRYDEVIIAANEADGVTPAPLAG